MNKMEAIPKRQKRSKPWEEKEETALIVEVLEREHTLFGDMKGPGTKSIHRERINTWQEITGLLNLQGPPNWDRSVESISFLQELLHK